MSAKEKGDEYSKKDEYDKAVADYTEAIRLDPKDASIYFNRGYAYLRKGEYDKAKADFFEVIRLDPKCASTYIRLLLALLL